MPQIFIECPKGNIETYTYPCNLPVWVMKNDFASKWSDKYGWICHGKELRNEDVLDRSMAYSTIRLRGRGKGGIIKTIIKIFSVIVAIFDGVIFILKAVWCAITQIQNLWYCLFFYVCFFFYRVLAIGFLVIYSIIDYVVEELIDFRPCQFLIDRFLEGLEIILEGADEILPGLKLGYEKIMFCFIC